MHLLRHFCTALAGEYIAVEKIEAVYKKNPTVEQIWVYGNSFENTLVAVVVPSEVALTSWAADAGISGDLAEILRDPRANSYVLGELTKTAKEAKLKVGTLQTFSDEQSYMDQAGGILGALYPGKP